MLSLRFQLWAQLKVFYELKLCDRKEVGIATISSYFQMGKLRHGKVSMLRISTCRGRCFLLVCMCGMVCVWGVGYYRCSHIWFSNMGSGDPTVLLLTEPSA